MSESAATAPPPVAPPDQGQQAATRTSRRWRWTLALGVCGVVVVLIASAAVWLLARGDDPGSSSKHGSPGMETRALVPDGQAPAFTFRMPEGFQAAGAEIPWGRLAGPTALTLQTNAIVPVVGGNVDNIVVINGRDAMQDTSADSDAEVEEGINRVRAISNGGDGPLRRRTVDGARGWGYSTALTSGGYAESWKLIKGSRQVTMSCFWSDDAMKERMLSGCEQVLDTMKIT